MTHETQLLMEELNIKEYVINHSNIEIVFNNGKTVFLEGPRLQKIIKDSDSKSFIKNLFEEAIKHDKE